MLNRSTSSVLLVLPVLLLARPARAADPLPLATAPPAPAASAPCPEVATDDEPDPDAPEAIEVDTNGCKKPRKKKSLEKASVFGIRGVVTHTSGAETDGTFVGAALGFTAEEFSTKKLFSTHGSSHASLGGGSAGLEGSLGATATFGIRAPIGEHHGPVARIGIGMELMGNSRFYFSRIALPIGELGYQYLYKKTALELGGRAAPILTGRYNTGHRTRRELGGGSLEWGGYLAVHTRDGRIDLSYTRIDADRNAPGGTVEVLRGVACGYVKERVAICADGMFIRGNASYFGPPAIPTAVDTLYGGVTIGVLAF